MRAIVILACLVAASNPAQAFREIRPSSAERTIAAQCVFVGTVTEIEEKTEEAKEFPGSKETTTHTVAVVKILDPIKGVDKVTHVRIGFVLRGDLGWRDHEAHEPMNPNLIKGAKYLFYVDKHPSAGFYLAPNRTNPRLLTEEMPKTDVVDEAKTTALKHLDEFGLLEIGEMPVSIDDLLNSDDFDLLDDDSGLLDVSDLPQRKAPEAPDSVAKRKKAEGFEMFEPLFKAKPDY